MFKNSLEDPNSKQGFEAKTHLLQFRNFQTLKFHPFCSLTLPATQFCPSHFPCIPLSLHKAGPSKPWQPVVDDRQKQPVNWKSNSWEDSNFSSYYMKHFTKFYVLNIWGLIAHTSCPAKPLSFCPCHLPWHPHEQLAFHSVCSLTS